MKLFLTWKYGIHLKEKNNFLKITLTSKGQKLQNTVQNMQANICFILMKRNSNNISHLTWNIVHGKYNTTINVSFLTTTNARHPELPSQQLQVQS